MSKVKTTVRKQHRIDLQNLSQRDIDFLKMETSQVMKKYKMEKQPVYDRRFALNKKIKESGMTLDQLMSKAPATEKPEVKAKSKRGRPSKPKTEKTTEMSQDNISENRQLMIVDKTVPVIMKPIEINFDNFSIKLNGVPKKISVNPETNAIEIDL